jgi:hypothetical protein
MSADVIVADPITVGLSSRGGASLLLAELLGNQIEHKLFGFITNQVGEPDDGSASISLNVNLSEDEGAIRQGSLQASKYGLIKINARVNLEGLRWLKHCSRVVNFQAR